MIQVSDNKDADRVVITGIGVVSPIGIGKDEFWRGLQEGKSGIRAVSLFDTSSISSNLAGQILDFNPELVIGSKSIRNLDRTTKLALCAAKLALDDSNYKVTGENSSDVGVVLGSTMGSVCSINEFDKEGAKNGPKSINPALFPNTVMNSPASQISIRFGITGFNTTISTGFASSLEAFDYAKKFLQLKRAKMVLVGGVEELCEQIYKGFYKIGFLSGSKNGDDELCAPFDRRRNGVVLGEGAAVYCMELFEDAERRGAHIYGELSSYSSISDIKSYYRYDLEGEGLRLAIKEAMTFSKVNAEEIDCIISSASSTKIGDLVEWRVITSIFGDKNDIPLTAIKSMIGESFSAGGAFQIGAALLGLQENLIPPTINYEQEDRKCPLKNSISAKSRNIKADNILISIISPMVQNSAAILKRCSA